jgi:hypothetical protein
MEAVTFREWRDKNEYGKARTDKHRKCSTCKYSRGLYFMECDLADRECIGYGRARRVGKMNRCKRWEAR